MNQEFFKNWKNGVDELNRTAEELSKGREEAYEVLANEIKKIFSRNGTVVDTIQFNYDASVITIELAVDTSKTIPFKKTFLYEIGMSFAVKWKISDKGDSMMYIELYPLDEGV